MAAQTISTGLMIGGGLLTYAAAGIVRMMRRQAGLVQLYEAATIAATNSNNTGSQQESGGQTFTRADKDGICEFNWWSRKALTEKDPEIAINRHNRAHGFFIKWNETRYTTPAYVNLGTALMPVGGGRPYDVERTRYSLFLARKEGAHLGAYTYNRYTNYRRTGAYSMSAMRDIRITNVNVREVMKYLDSRCQDYYITAPVNTAGFTPANSAINAVAAVPASTTTSATTTNIVPSVGNDPAGNLYVFFDNQLDVGQRVLEYDTQGPNPEEKLDSRPIYFARFKAMRHFNVYNGYFARDINDIFWRYGLDARYPLTFFSGLVGGVMTYWNW